MSYPDENEPSDLASTIKLLMELADCERDIFLPIFEHGDTHIYETKQEEEVDSDTEEDLSTADEEEDEDEEELHVPPESDKVRSPADIAEGSFFWLPGYDLTFSFPYITGLPHVPTMYIRLIRFMRYHYLKVEWLVGRRTARLVSCLWNAHRRRNEYLDLRSPGDTSEPIIEVGMLEEFILSVMKTTLLLNGIDPAAHRAEMENDDDEGYDASGELDDDLTPVTLPEATDWEWRLDNLPLIDDLCQTPYGFRSQSPIGPERLCRSKSDQETMQEIIGEVERGASLQRKFNQNRESLLAALDPRRL